jgi:hypothetical protein
VKLQRYDGNPIQSPNPANHWEELAVFNPAAWYDQGKKQALLLYRAAESHPEYKCYFGLASSRRSTRSLLPQRPALGILETRLREDRTQESEDSGQYELLPRRLQRRHRNHLAIGGVCPPYRATRLLEPTLSFRARFSGRRCSCGNGLCGNHLFLPMQR